MKRREFLHILAGLGGATVASPLFNAYAHTSDLPGIIPIKPALAETQVAQVAFVKTQDRVAGVNKALDLLATNSVKGKSLFLKPNFNSADPTPGSTHPQLLGALIKKLQAMGAAHITVGDRSGMGNTQQVMEQVGLYRMADELGFDTVVFDKLTAADWERLQPESSHWKNGFALPRQVLKADGIVQTCCLKTHRFGGHFTLSLKNSVGLAAKVIPGEGYNYMTELHGSPNQRLMIAEINAAYKPDLVILDGVEAFVDGGPDRGKKVNASVILAGHDRIAIDAVGVAILRYFGTTPAVSRGAIFAQEQIAQAVTLGLGVDSPEKIEFITDDPDSAAYAAEIRRILKST